MKGKARKELEKVQSCSKKVRNEEGVSAACGHSLHEVFSCAEERLGSVCYRGHFTPNPDLKGKFQRHKCKGCKSKWRYRHYSGCPEVQRVTSALHFAEKVAEEDLGGPFEHEEDKWELVQATLAFVLAVDDLRIGGEP